MRFRKLLQTSSPEKFVVLITYMITYNYDDDDDDDDGVCVCECVSV